MGSTVRLVPSPIINTTEWSGFCADLLCVEIFKNKILVSARKKKQLFLHFPQVYSTCLPWLSVIKAFFLSRYDLESAFTFEVHVLVTRSLTAFFSMNTSYASKWTNLILHCDYYSSFDSAHLENNAFLNTCHCECRIFKKKR